MFTDFDHPWLCPLAFIVFLLAWHVLGPRLLKGHSRIPSPDLHDVLDTLTALLCWYFLWYPSPLLWHLVFTFLRRRITRWCNLRWPALTSSGFGHIFTGSARCSTLYRPPQTLSQQSISQRPRQSEPIANVNQPVHTPTSQLPPKDSTQLLKDLLRSPIVLPSFPGMQSSYQPIAKPIALSKKSDMLPISRPTTGSDDRVSTTTRFDKGKQPMGTSLDTMSNFERLPISTRNCDGPHFVDSASKASLLGKRKHTDMNSARMRSLLMAGALDVIPPVEPEKRRKVDDVVRITSSSTVGKE